MLLQFSSDRTYKAAYYLRLSKEDGDFSLSSSKTESNSIAGQRLLIQDYLKGHPEIELVREYCDDGYSGANFDRPSFQQMIDAVKAGEMLISSALVIRQIPASAVHTESKRLLCMRRCLLCFRRISV